ncbi:MAG: LptF/LptG family permease, partial [Armatimonadetes bacterium]|nr:LptF/LptG family permease [Armatimonadota bacterium]
DRLVWGEILGPWLFGVAIFTVLIMAGSLLFKITEYSVKGAGSSYVTQLILLLLPGVMAKTFPMAVLLAALLSFGRLSGESEIIAMRAVGINLTRIMRPVAIFGFGVALLAFSFNELVVPWAALRATEVEEKIKQQIDGTQLRPTSYAMFDKSGHITSQIMAADFSFMEGTLTDATLATYDRTGKVTYILNAHKLKFKSEQEWEIKGEATLISSDGKSAITVDGAWPTEIPKLEILPDEIKASKVKDLDAYSMRRMGELIIKARQNPKVSRDQVANLEYGYWSKISVPFASLVFALVGAPLGIRNHRTGASTGFWMAVLIIFAYFLVTNMMSMQARGGAIPPWTAAFAPLLFGLIYAAVTIKRKN